MMGSARARTQVRRSLVALLGLSCLVSTSGCLTAVGSVDAPAEVSRTDPRPNVVLVVADDLGWSDVSSGRMNLGHPSPWNQTPAIARMAAQGTALVDAYAMPTCAPSRMAMMTGRYAPRPENNVYGVKGLDGVVGRPPPPLEGVPQGRSDGATVLADRTTTVAEALQGAGYTTGQVGKFHVTRDAESITTEHGFDVNYGGSGLGSFTRYYPRKETRGGDFRYDLRLTTRLDAFAQKYTEDYVEDNVAPYSSGVGSDVLGRLVGTRKHLTDAMTDASLDFMSTNADDPFALFLNHFGVHSPTTADQARRDLMVKYRRARSDLPPGQRSGERSGQRRLVPSYSAQVEGLDQSVARLLEYLETTPDPRNPGATLDENTVVVFTSDNGALTTGPFREGSGAVGGSNGPLRGQKGELGEGGIRVPWVAWSGDPELVRRGRIDRSVVDVTDLFPTLAAYADAWRPADLDGVSLRGLLARGESVTRPRFGHFPGYLLSRNRDQRPESYVRDGRWKLVYSYEDRRVRLYDVRRDLGERRDRAARAPRVRQRLALELVRWLDELDAPLAVVRDGRAPLRVRVARGTTTYRDGRIVRHRTARTLVLRAGDEMPVVLRGR